MDISKEKKENPGQDAPMASTEDGKACAYTRTVIIQAEHLQENNIFLFSFFFCEQTMKNTSKRDLKFSLSCEVLHPWLPRGFEYFIWRNK